MGARNVHKEEKNIFKLPIEAIAEDRGLSFCEVPQLVVASLDDAAYYKNDRTSFAFKFDSMDVYLVDASGNEYEAPGTEIAFPYQSDAVGFVIDWRQVEDGGVLIQGCWRVKVYWNIAGNTGFFWYGSYDLKEYSPFNVRGTVRLFVVLNDLVRKQGINYKDSGFAGTVRFKGFFGDMQPNYDIENIIYTDRTREKVRNEALRTYELRSNYLLHCMTRLIDEEHLLAANQIYISDHNAQNHVQNYYDFPVILSQEESPKFDYTGTIYAKITALFNDKVQVHESKYDGNIKGSSNIILSLPTVVSSPATCESATYHLKNTNGTELSSGTITSGGTEDIVAPDAHINIKKTADGTIASIDVPSGTTENYEVPNNEITVNGANDFEIKATDPLDIVLTDGSATIAPESVTYNSGTHHVDIVLPAAPSPTYSSAELMKTGQTTSYRTGDDGDLEKGRGSSFSTLISNNVFGNSNRFTDTLGGTTYANNWVIDWSTYNGSTVLGYYMTSIGLPNVNWNTAIDSAQGTFGGFSGCRLPNKRELENICNYQLTQLLNYAPFNYIGVSWWCSTTYGASTTIAHVLSGSWMNLLSKTDVSARYLPCRTFTVTGTTLS